MMPYFNVWILLQGAFGRVKANKGRLLVLMSLTVTAPPYCCLFSCSHPSLTRLLQFLHKTVLWLWNVKSHRIRSSVIKSLGLQTNLHEFPCRQLTLMTLCVPRVINNEVFGATPNVIHATTVTVSRWLTSVCDRYAACLKALQCHAPVTMYRNTNAGWTWIHV